MLKNGQITCFFILLTFLFGSILGCGLSNGNTTNTKDASESETISSEGNKTSATTEVASVPQTKENLNFRITWKAYSGRGEAINKIVQGYNASTSTNYQVTVVDGDEDLTTIENLLHNTSDIDIYMLPYRYVQYFGYENLLGNLTSDFQVEKDYFYVNLWNLGVVGDQVYGIPWMGHTMGLIYNKNLLDKAGVDPADITDLDALVLACEKVETSTDAMGIGLVGAEHNDVSWMVNQFIYGFGGTLVSADGTKVTINSPQSIAALEFYRDSLGSHAQPSWKTDTGVEVMDAFRNQSVAFEIEGPWGVTDIWKSDNSFETGVIPLENIGIYPEVGPMMLSIPANLDADKNAAVLDFIRYLISTKAQEQIMDGEYSPEHDSYYPFRLPVRIDIAESEVFDNYPEFVNFLSGFNKPSIDVPVPLWQQIKEQFYQPGLHQVMEGQLSIEDFLQEIEENGNKILNGEQ